MSETATGGSRTGPRPGIGQLIVGLLRRPTPTLEDLARDPAGWKRGLTLMVLMALAYTVTDVMLALGKVDPIPEPFLRIPTDQYYWWAAIFYGATFLAAWLLATAAMQLTARATGGTGDFEDLIAATGLATVVATLPTLIPDFVTSALVIYDTWATSGLLQIVPWIYIALYNVLFLIFYPWTVAVVHRLPRNRSIPIGVAGFVVYQGFLFIFIR